MPVSFTPQEIADYRAKKQAEKDKLAEEAKEAEQEALKAKRESLEKELEKRFKASGGSAAEWTVAKRRIIGDAIAKMTLEPEPEPEAKPKAPAPLSKFKYRN